MVPFTIVSSLSKMHEYGERRMSVDTSGSTDINGSPYSCIFDSQLTMAHGRTAKVFGWYDNEWGYSCRLVDVMTRLLA